MVRVVVVRVLEVRTQNFLSSAARVSGTNAKIFQIPALRGIRTRASGARDSGTNAKFSKSSPAWKWYERKIYEFKLRVVVVRVVMIRTKNFPSPAVRGGGTNAKFSKSSRVW